jgi:hypothetical protein
MCDVFAQEASLTLAQIGRTNLTGLNACFSET